MFVYSLNQFITEIDTTPRIYFHKRINLKDNNIITNIDNFIEANKTKIIPILIGTTFIAVGNENANSSKEIVHIFKQSNFKSIKDYYDDHLRNSLIINFLFNENFSMSCRLNQIVFLLYYKKFITNNELFNTITGITHNVCFELEEIIKLIIQKEFTLYREKNTKIVIDALRQRLSSEQLLNMSNVPFSINFRS